MNEVGKLRVERTAWLAPSRRPVLVRALGAGLQELQNRAARLCAVDQRQSRQRWGKALVAIGDGNAQAVQPRDRAKTAESAAPEVKKSALPVSPHRRSRASTLHD